MSTVPSMQQQSHQSSGMSAGGGNQRRDAGVGQGDSNAAKADASSSTIFEQGDKSNVTFTNDDLFRNPALVQALLQQMEASSSERQQSVNTSTQQNSNNAAVLRQFLPASNTTDSSQRLSNTTMQQLLQQLPQELLAGGELNATGSVNAKPISSL